MWAMYQLWFRILKTPRRFFQKEFPKMDWQTSMGFLVLTRVTVLMVLLILFGALGKIKQISVTGHFFFALVNVGLIVFGAWVTHLFVKKLESESSWLTTLSLFACAQAAYFLKWIPFVGTELAFVGILFLLFIGFQEVYGFERRVILRRIFLPWFVISGGIALAWMTLVLFGVFLTTLF